MEQLFFPTIENGDTEIRSLCWNSAKSKYGDTIPEPIANRLQRELDLIVEHRHASPYLMARRVAHIARADGYTIGVRGSVGSCIVSYFLGISEINPLSPHYLCQQCRHCEWIAADSAASGFDLPDKSCPECGNGMKGDGHNVPFETFLGLRGDKRPNIDLNVAPEYEERLFARLQQLSNAGTIRLDKADDYQSSEGVMIVPFRRYAESGALERALPTSVHRLDILRHDEPSIKRLLHEYTGLDPQTIPMNDPNVLSLFHSPNELGVTAEQIRTEAATYGIPEMGVSFVRSMLRETKPTCFSELLQITGLSHGTGTWEGSAQHWIESGACTLSDAISCRDNLMLELIRHGMDDELAYKIADNVRRGNGVPDDWAAEMDKRGLPGWFIDSCKSIGYLFPKAHAVSYVMAAVVNAYYKLYFPLEFYAAYFTTRGQHLDTNIAVGGYESIIAALEQADLEPTGKSALEVALEMTARGGSFRKETVSEGQTFHIEYKGRSLRVPL